MIGVILLIDQLIWRPAIAWSSKFKFEQVESAHAPTSPLLHLLRNSRVLNAFREKTVEPLGRTDQPLFRPPDRGIRVPTATPAWLKALGALCWRSWRSPESGTRSFKRLRFCVALRSGNSKGS